MRYYINFNYKDIFPKCITHYDNATSESIGNVNINIKNACELIIHMLEVKHEKKKLFLDECIVLSYFLKVINSRNNEKEIGCNYFNYKLKQLLRQCKFKHENTKTAYDEMNKAYGQHYSAIHNICTDLKNLDEDTFLNLYFLEWLYYFLQVYEEEKGGTSRCPMKMLDYNKYLIFLSECDQTLNKSFCEIIKELQTQKSDYINFISKCLEDAKLSAITTETNTVRVAVATFIVLFTILIILFIFYRFTFLGLCLQRKLWRIRSHLNYENKDNYILNDIFELEYKRSIQDEYKVEYSSVGY
ncbi:variable surface protein [Plasmodium gonderi]|uniref:Variable surface protein n=1 Tax=Plasmodium gonderi TaxID=77519 RepID=A0A1Y1JNW1_PLAGO|nr:variable surface protein [Plasmodium gonderi]GAW84161.1 variable surface protein [Plasmodium gonderi]